jgi:hypothetical protein
MLDVSLYILHMRVHVWCVRHTCLTVSTLFRGWTHTFKSTTRLTREYIPCRHKYEFRHIFTRVKHVFVTCWHLCVEHRNSKRNYKIIKKKLKTNRKYDKIQKELGKSWNVRCIFVCTAYVTCVCVFVFDVLNVCI